jgi:hypothetical protein
MKRNLLLFAALVFITIAKAQLTTVWEKSAGSSYTWFTTTSGNTTGCAYNPLTNKLLLADRNNLIAIVNVTNGNSEGTLTTTPHVGTESFKWNKIRVTADGVIYAVSLATASPFLCKVYRWENQAANPTLCASFNANERCGDAFGLSGTGANTVLYVSGNGITSSSVNIYVLTTANETDFSLSNTINIPITGTNAWAGRSIDPITTGTSSDLWIRSQNTNTRRISSTGTVLYTSTDGLGIDQVRSNFSNARYFATSDGSKFLALMGTSSEATGGLKLKVLNITNEAAVNLLDSSQLTNNYNTNTSGIGDVAIKNNGDGSFTLFYLITNNGVMAVTTNVLLPVTISSFKGKIINNTALLNWNTSNETNNLGFEIERSADGIKFSRIGFVASKSTNGSSSNAAEYSFDDNKALLGNVYYRLKQTDKDGKYHYSSIVVLQNLKSGILLSLQTNPIKDNLMLNISSTQNKEIALLIYNQLGTLLIKQNVSLNVGANKVAINTAKLSSGSLVIKAVTNNHLIQTLQVIKQ